jgi:hemerythrin-like domain-containing protein
MKSTKHLIDEHKLILRALDVLDAMSASAAGAGEADEGDIDSLLDFLRWFADAHHQTKEETILFPALSKAAAAQARPVEHMVKEHEQERNMIEAMEKAVRLERFTDFTATANRLSSTLRNHIYKEDQILFDNALHLLDASTDDRVFEAMQRFATALDKQTLEEKTRVLRSLEWKYLRK